MGTVIHAEDRIVLSEADDDGSGPGGTERQLIEMKRRYAEEAKSITDQVMKNVKSNYKELCGESISAKEASSVDSVEIINFNVHNPRRTAYYRRKTVFEIG